MKDSVREGARRAGTHRQQTWVGSERQKQSAGPEVRAADEQREAQEGTSRKTDTPKGRNWG